MTKPAPRPSTVEVAGAIYTVVDGETGDDNTHAITDMLRARITMRDERPECAQRADLLHEVMHAVWHAVGLDQPKPAADVEEQVIAALAPTLLETLRRNPGLAGFLLR